MNRNLSRIAVLMLALVMILTSAMAVYAEAGGDEVNDGAGEEEAAIYIVSFDPNGGSGSMDDVAVTDAEGDGESYALPDCSYAAPEGTEFDRWKVGNDTYSTGEEIALDGDIVAVAQWIEIPDAVYYTVTFTDGEGKTLSIEEVESGKPASAPALPARSGYHFNGWDKDFSDVTSDITVNATWHQNHTFGAWTTTVGPTYFRTGTKVHKCSCGASEIQTIARLTVRNRWVNDSGKLYYFGSNGSPITGWQKMKPYKTKKVKWCYFSQSGIYVKSVNKNTRNKWVNAGGYKFRFTKKRKPAGPGFNTVKKKLYHMNSFGAVMYGTFKASDGNTYTTAKDGSITGLAYYKIRYKTFVLVDISEQTIWFYKNGKQELKSDVVTGTKGVHNTPTGIFKIRSKQRNINLIGPTWNSHVSYWMAFKGSSWGLHDASWRSSAQFSNHRTYLSNGSHGCVNLKPSVAATLYGMVKKGTTVIIQQ